MRSVIAKLQGPSVYGRRLGGPKSRRREQQVNIDALCIHIGLGSTVVTGVWGQLVRSVLLHDEARLYLSTAKDTSALSQPLAGLLDPACVPRGQLTIFTMCMLPLLGQPLHSVSGCLVSPHPSRAGVPNESGVGT